jgi:3-deoxy-D-manno-octulosonic-acid transferase
VMMNLVYGIVILLVFPLLLVRSLRTGRYRRNISAKLFGTRAVSGQDDRPAIWFHGVSVGEVHLLRQVVRGFRERHPDWQVVISSTTDTGLAEATKHFPNLQVIAYPFDFSWSVRRTIGAIAPKIVVLAESELWPNFLRAANRVGIPVAVINGRMSPKTFRRYSRIAWLARRLLFNRVTAFAMQSETFAKHLRELGVDSNRVRVTGSVKYDGAIGERDHPKTTDLRRLFGLNDDNLVWVAGSTHEPEERIVLSVYGRLRSRFPSLRLIIVPRAPERFDEVARLVEAAGCTCVRRSRAVESEVVAPDAVILIDTLGELGAAWGLATIGFTGGSLNEKRGGQSMIEPAGLGVPVLFGPHTWNFRDAVEGLLENRGAIQIQNEAELERAADRLLLDSKLRLLMGAAAKQFARQQQGATARTLDILDNIIAQRT